MPAEKVLDRRILKTRLALREALLSLLTTHAWDDLSIQEICERADVGRSTFYLHFDSKDDLLSESLNDLRDAFVNLPQSVPGITRVLRLVKQSVFNRGHPVE